jgi:arachidonate 5-lipoxygenase
MRALWQKFQLWLYTWLWVLAVSVNSGMRRRRMTHNNAVLGRGFLKIVDNPEFPENDFFQPGREFPCRLRHGSANYMDDCMRVVRSASIKFADTRFKSPFDIEMNTGRRNFFWTAYLFLYCGITRRPTKDGHAYRAYFDNVEGSRVAAKEGFRRRAESFAKMHFHSQVPLGFQARDGKPRYVKFRLIPGDRGPDTGFAEPTGVDTPEHLSDFRVLPDETRGRNYLKEEYRERVTNKGPAEYIFQIALHEVSPDDSPEILNSNEPWDEATHPWMDLAHVTINEVLDYRESVLTSFSFANFPREIFVLPAKSIHDYNSINYMRRRTGMARRVRLFVTRMFGLPEEYAGDGERNIRAPGA